MAFVESSMQIDTRFSLSEPPAAASSTSANNGADFAEAWRNSVAKANKKAPEPSPEERERQRLAAAQAAHAAVLKELHDYLNKSPAEHLREAVLKELGLSEEKLQSMPPKEREAAEAQINVRIRERLLGRKPAEDEESAQLAASNGPLTADGAVHDGRVVSGADMANLQALIARMQAAAHS